MNMETSAAQQALQRAAQAALTSARVLPSTSRAAVSRVEEQQQEYRRAAYVIESRAVHLEVDTARGTKKAEIAPRPDPRSVDPWQVDPRRLPDETRRVAVCPGCEGSKKQVCPPCGGDGSLRCGECGGGGRVMGQRGSKNCPSCRGSGSRRCNRCNGRGQVTCEPCDGLGRVYAWLEVDESRRTQVLGHPKTGVAMLHPELELALDLERDPGLFPSPLDSDTGWGRDMPSGLDPELIVSIDPFSDRIAARRLQVFRSTVFHFHYELLTGSGVVQVAGRHPQVLAESQWAPWRRRWIWSLAAGGLMLGLAVAYHSLFVGRAEWFARQPSVGTIAVLGLLAALLSIAAMAGYCLPGRARPWFRFRIPMAGAAGAWAWMLLLWLVVTPTAEGVRAATQHGELEAARREARAVEVVDGSTEELRLAMEELEAAEAEAERQRRLALDEEHLLRVQQASSAVLAAGEVARPWEFEESRNAAVQHLRRRADTELEELVELQDRAGLETLAEALTPLDEARATRIGAYEALAEAFQCRRNGDMPCVVRSLQTVHVAAGDTAVAAALDESRQAAKADLEQRLKKPPLGKTAELDDRQERLRGLLEDAKVYQELTGEPPPVDEEALGQQLEAVERALGREEERDEARHQREERQATREAAREEARRLKAEAAAERRADRVECCDGTRSPSCRYSQGSLRGCCSHHGGVC
jgi:hypothetical protein